MNWKQYWTALNKKKPITGNIIMTPEQFEHMLNQTFVAGEKNGKATVKAVDDLLKKTQAAKQKPDLTDAFGDMFGGMFGKKND